MTKISSIEGIGPAYSEKLASVGILTVEKLLEVCAGPKGREEIVERTGLRREDILTWVNHADLFRIRGISSQHSELLEASGVDTVPELALRNAANLVAKMEEVNAGRNLVRRTPTLKMVEKWIAQAKKMPKVVNH